MVNVQLLGQGSGGNPSKLAEAFVEFAFDKKLADKLLGQVLRRLLGRYKKAPNDNQNAVARTFSFRNLRPQVGNTNS